MEPSRDLPWAEHEKLCLLAEIIKASPVSSDALFHFVRAHGIQPRWFDMALPPGRSLRQCQAAFQDILTTNSADPRSAGPVQYHHQPPPMYAPPVEIPRKRPLAPDVVSTPTGRLLQPRPPNAYPADAMSGMPYMLSPTMGESTNKKRRGRPTKAEAQARAAEAAARGEPYPPPRTGKRASLQASPGPPAPGHMPVSTMMRVSAGSNVEPASPDPDSTKEKRATPANEHDERPGDATASPTVAGAQQPPAESSRVPAFTQPSPAVAVNSTVNKPEEREVRPEPVDQYKRQTPTPHSFKETVGI